MAEVDAEAETMEAVLDLSPEEARTYSMILEAASTLPKSDPRFALTVTFTWWLLHRRRRLEQQRVRRRQFYRRMRRLIFLRWHLQRNAISAMTLAAQPPPVRRQRRVTGGRRGGRGGGRGAGPVPDKRLWVRKDRNEDFWTKVDNNLLSDETFRRHFHMSKETFEYVYEELAEQLQKSNTNMRDPLPAKKRLAATIYRLATNSEYIRVANLFGIGKSTTTSLVRDVCEVIVENLKDKFLTFSGEGLSKEDMEKKVDEASEKFGISKVVGVLGAIDVLMVGSSWDWSESSPYVSSYHKHLHSYAVTFQAVVDNNGIFSHVTAGKPASLTNRELLDQSGLRDEFLEKFTINDGEVSGGELAARLVADESYYCNKNGDKTENEEQSNDFEDYNWLLTPNDIEVLVEDETLKVQLVEKVAESRAIFDEAVLGVKARWKIFHGKNGKINFSADAFEKVTLACCILHNICELQDDKVDPSWATDLASQVFHRTGRPKDPPAPEVVDVEDDEIQMVIDESPGTVIMSGATGLMGPPSQ